VLLRNDTVEYTVLERTRKDSAEGGDLDTIATNDDNRTWRGALLAATGVFTLILVSIIGVNQSKLLEIRAGI